MRIQIANLFLIRFGASCGNTVRVDYALRNCWLYSTQLTFVLDDDLLRFFRLSECNVPTRDNVESFTRWMHAVKPLIEPESRFSRYVDDLVTVNRDVEEGILEEIIEKFARRYGIGNGVRTIAPLC